MYQTIVLGLGFLLLFGGGYLIKYMDKEGLLASKIAVTQPIIATTTDATVTSSSVINIAGRYLCDSESGCPNPSLLLITEAGEVTMSTTYANGAEVLQESGTWKTEKGGRLTVFITGTDSNVYEAPHLLSVQYVSQYSLSGVTFDRGVYPDWSRPVFRKQVADI